MGTYINLKTNRKEELKSIFNHHKLINPMQFLNDFGDKNEFEDVFEQISENEFNLKIGVADKEFYERNFLKDIYVLLIENCEVLQEKNHKIDKYWYELNGVSGIRLMKRLPYMLDFCNIYTHERTKLGNEWRGSVKETLIDFVLNNECFFDKYFIN